MPRNVSIENIKRVYSFSDFLFLNRKRTWYTAIRYDEGNSVRFIWVPPVIPSREAMKSEHSWQVSFRVFFLHSHFSHYLSRFKKPNQTSLTWQIYWQKRSTKLDQIESSIFTRPPSSSRKHQTILDRIRIGNTWLTRGFSMEGNTSPFLFYARKVSDRQHITVDYGEFQEAKFFFNISPSLVESFSLDPRTNENLLTSLNMLNYIN